jgi:hypothetical protein
MSENEQAEARGWRKSCEGRYHEMLGALPPAAWIGDGFLVGEALDHDREGNPRFEAHFKTRTGYWCALNPMTLAEFVKLARVGGPQ